MRLSWRLGIHELAFESGSEAIGPFATAADQAYSASGQPFDRRYADLLLQAARNRLAFVELEIQRSGQGLAFRLAAANASLALE